ncbi:MAG: hypothetical protein ABIK15_18995 [Pseudomonadota bacterium]
MLRIFMVVPPLQKLAWEFIIVDKQCRQLFCYANLSNLNLRSVQQSLQQPQIANFLGNHGKALAVVVGACGFDGNIKCWQVGKGIKG